MRRSFSHAAMPLAAAVLALPGCAGSTADLTPAPTARTLAPEIAVSEVNGVSFEVNAEAWTGNDGVRDHVTPVLVTIENDGDEPLQIRYGEMSLIAANGTRYSAVPPFRVSGQISEHVETRYTPMAHPWFEHRGFHISPKYLAIYPSLDADAPFRHDELYHSLHADYWATIPLPTEEMLDRALPEGVIDVGGRVTGFVYFESIDPAHRWVRFRADLIGANSGDTFGEVTIRFDVSRDQAAVIPAHTPSAHGAIDLDVSATF